MASRKLVSAFMLAVLTALPVSGSVCALLCDAATATATAGRHGSAADCEAPARSSTGVHVRGVADHDCGAHDTAIRQAALAATKSASASVTAIALATNVVAVTFSSRVEASSDLRVSPPGTAPPTTSPLVLRI